MEMAVGIICACLPSFRSLLSHVFPAIKMSLVSRGEEPQSYTLSTQARKSQIQRIDSQASFFELSEQNERGSRGTSKEGVEVSMHTTESQEEAFQKSLRPKEEGEVTSRIAALPYDGCCDGKREHTILVTTDVDQTCGSS
jgi:hypothetical protein